MSAPLAFLHAFRDRLRAAGIRFAITSGMACVHYGLQQTTKDSDWIIAPEDLEKLRAVLLALEAELPPCVVGYRVVFGAPLDASWLAHGWTSHLFVRDEPLGLEHHLDFFGRPPRVRSWTADSSGFASRMVVAQMKRTDRDRDWPIVDGLGWQLASEESSLAEALVHVLDGARLRSVWQAATRDQRSAAVARRPLLAKLDAERDTDRLEGWIRLERLVWQSVNRERYGRYQLAWKEFYRRWRSEPDWSWPTSEGFEPQHRRLLAAAHTHGLPEAPFADTERGRILENGIAKAAALGLTSVELVRSVAPPLEEVLP